MVQMEAAFLSSLHEGRRLTTHIGSIMASLKAPTASNPGGLPAFEQVVASTQSLKKEVTQACVVHRQQAEVGFRV